MAWTNKPSHVPTHQRNRILKRDYNTCQLCGTTTGPFDIDHIRPRSQGGPDIDDNLRTLCKPCHAPKSEKEKVAGLRRYHANRNHPRERHPGMIG